MTDSIHLARFIEHMLDGDNFDPNIKDFSAEARSALISAGDNIEDVLTSTLNVLAQSPTIQLRDFDPAATRALVERLRFWEALVTALEVIHRMARDQELVLEDSLQRTANHINKELKHYTDDNALRRNQCLAPLSRLPGEGPRRGGEGLFERTHSSVSCAPLPLAGRGSPKGG
jgi:hypothetical protein